MRLLFAIGLWLLCALAAGADDRAAAAWVIRQGGHVPPRDRSAPVAGLRELPRELGVAETPLTRAAAEKPRTRLP